MIYAIGVYALLYCLWSVYSVYEDRKDGKWSVVYLQEVALAIGLASIYLYMSEFDVHWRHFIWPILFIFFLIAEGISLHVDLKDLEDDECLKKYKWLVASLSILLMVPIIYMIFAVSFL